MVQLELKLLATCQCQLDHTPVVALLQDKTKAILTVTFILKSKYSRQIASSNGFISDQMLAA